MTEQIIPLIVVMLRAANVAEGSGSIHSVWRQDQSHSVKKYVKSLCDEHEDMRYWTETRNGVLYTDRLNLTWVKVLNRDGTEHPTQYSIRDLVP